jgi:hypothetical protein
MTKPVYHVRLAGKDYPIRFGFRAQSEFCEHKGWNLSDLERMGDRFALSDLPVLLLIGLRDHARHEGRGFEKSEADIVDLLDDDATTVIGEGGVLVQAVMAFMRAAQSGASTNGTEEGAKKKRPAKKAAASPGTTS